MYLEYRTYQWYDTTYILYNRPNNRNINIKWEKLQQNL